MRQAIRALGWATNIFWIILLFFTATALYSAFQLGFGIEPPLVSATGATMTVSLPLYVNNRGFYDISDFIVATLIHDRQGATISNSSTLVPLISRGVRVDAAHNISLSMPELIAKGLTYLLFNNTEFDVGLSLRLVYARAVPFRVSTNVSLPWGAPLHNLSILSPTPYNSTHVSAPVSFENHSPFSLNGTIRLELLDSADHLLGSGTANINVPPNSGYSFPFLVSVPDPLDITKARLHFDTSVFTYGPVVIPLV